MAELSASIRLRPTRIGFLVRPTDVASVRKIMRVCTCLWGGIYNPIIPVFKVAPKEWRGEIYASVKGPAIAKGYVEFFEPDVYVEATKGLLEEAGLGAFRGDHSYKNQVVSLSEFLAAANGRDFAEVFFGLNIVDVLRDLFESELRFKLRKDRPAVSVKPVQGSVLTEALFGVFPSQKNAEYFNNGYKDVYSPLNVGADVDTWLKVFFEGAVTPLAVTKHRLDVQRYWHHDLIIYVFDPTRLTDLIDLWNLRLEPRPVLPVPINWFSRLKEKIVGVIKNEHRPVQGNPHGVMHHATIEFGRSITNTEAQSILDDCKKQIPAGALHAKLWRNQIWIKNIDDRIYRDRRLQVTADEKRVKISVNGSGHTSTEFDSLYPKFAERFRYGRFRWANVVGISSYGIEQFATVLPFNTFDRRWPRLDLIGEHVAVGSEGWVFAQEHVGWNEAIQLLSMDEALKGWLKCQGVESKLSEPGHIAKQMLEQLGGIWGVYLLADVETIELLNKMAGGVRVRSDANRTTEEAFELRSAPIKTWTDLVSRRKASRSHSRVALSEFTDHNVIRLGLETVCVHCQAKNWHSLSVVDYSVTCERCLKSYDFPQAGIKGNNQNWNYRVIGPFSVPDYARGAYASLIALRFLNSYKSGREAINFSTSMNLSFDGKSVEVDFMGWIGGGEIDERTSPDLIIGETKSFGRGDLIKQRDLEKLRLVAKKFPGATVVISVLKKEFTASEKKRLISFAKWCRRLNDRGRISNPLLILTANELFFDFMLSSHWEKLGVPWKSYANYESTKNLYSLADVSQRLYLGLSSFDTWRRSEWKKRAKRMPLKSGSSS